jgi:hypothetical protein
MRSYFIVSKDVAIGYKHYFANSHWVGIPNSTDVILSAKFTHDHKEEDFSKINGVNPLPHILDTSAIPDEHLPKLKHLNIKKGHTMKDLKKSLKKQHCLM